MTFVTIFVGVCASSVRICPDHNLYNDAWISKQFSTVVDLAEEKYHFKHIKVGRFQNNFAQSLSLRRRSAI